MRQVLSLLLCILLPPAVFAASENSYKVNYDGGSIPDIKTGTGLKLLHRG